MCNFHEAVLSLKQLGEVRMVCNAYSQLVAFAAPRSNESDIDLVFVDCPPLAAALGPLWTPLSQEELGAFPTPAVLAHLGEAELHEIKHWKPQTVGEIVFNFWD